MKLRTMESAKGLFTAAIPPLDGDFLYQYDRSCDTVSVGDRIELPFGRRSVTGFVLSVDSPRETSGFEEMEQRGITVKCVSVKDAVQAFSHDQYALFEWMSKYYCEPISKILDLAIPSFASGRKDPLFTLISTSIPNDLGKAQQRIVDFIVSQGGSAYSSALRAELKNISSPLNALISKGVIAEADRPPPDTSQATHYIPSQDILNDSQQQAGEEIAAAVLKNEFTSFLLHGVTGSGKTEVYMHAIRAALDLNKGSLIIVPEIALTPQLVERFERKVGASIAVLHSNLKPKERWANWSRLLSGEVKIALGARSAIFAPIQDLGLVVVDEEHDGSFKQGEGIRYNARDLALVRGKMSQSPVVLGSATPSLETFHNATLKKHVLLNLPGRFHNGKKLKYTLIDLNKMKPWEMPSRSISHQLVSLIQNTLDRGDQAFILYNRRGFASYLQCTHCEHVVKCPHCSVTLTFHQRPVALLCHFCGYSSAPLIVCSSCNRSEPKERKGEVQSSSPFALRGGGTERIFEELQGLFPKARLAKLDRDTAQSITDYTEILGKVRAGEVDILVGTQMIAKGHDLPDVTFVGVVDCDVGLHMPDFRASERIYQLLTQVAGRAGRREKQGLVALQTRLPQHPSITMTIREDYESFAEHELNERKQLGHPPFQRLLRIIVSAEDRNSAQIAAQHIASVAAPLAAHYEVRIMGPVSAPIEKVRRHWRFHLLGKSVAVNKLQAFMAAVKQGIQVRKEIRVIFDIDPQDMM